MQASRVLRSSPILHNPTVHSSLFELLPKIGRMVDTSGLPARPVMFMAGNDPAAKEAVAQLLYTLGFARLDAGHITKARLLEPFGML